MPTQGYTISHTGSVLGDDAVDRQANQVAPQRETAVLSFTCPENFDSILAVFPRDTTRFYPRTKEQFDGDDATTTFDLVADVLPTAGETTLNDQPEPAVVATVDGGEVEIESIDYAANEVTLESAPATGNGNVALYPLLTEGTLKFRGVNQLGQVQGPIYPWTWPLYRFADMEQEKAGTEINLNGRVRWDRNETVEVMINSPHEVVWEDTQYPDAYVSAFEQDVEITF